MSEESLTLEEAAELPISDETQPGEHSEAEEATEQAEADKHEAETDEASDEEERAEEPQEEEPEEEDDRPEWDKDDEDGDSEETKDGGRYASPKAKVKLPDGSEVQVSELIENGLRHSDYTRKAQEVAQSRQQYEQQMAGVQQFYQQLEQQQNLILNAAQQMLPQAPTAQDWQDDPVGAGQRKAQYDEAIQKLQNMQQQMAGHQQQMTQQQQQAYWQQTQEHQRRELDSLYRAMPQLRDQKKAEAFTTDLSTGLSQHYGFKPEELQLINDHRNILVAADALRYRRLMANKSAAQNKAKSSKPKQAAPVTRSGKRQTGDEARAQSVSRVEERLGKKSSLDYDEAAEILMARNRR